MPRLERFFRDSTEAGIIFDSTGLALQDVITATIIYEKAVKNSVGTLMEFAA
jgi:ornithine cyclodeaminase/alanine dehydrogenase-like protein (mu-crystallin family)